MKRIPHSLPLALMAACTLAALIIAQLGAVRPALAAATISGAIFRDLDADGALDANETGVGAVTVTAYDAAGASQGTAPSFNTLCLGAGNPVPECTAANTPAIGSYSLSAAGTGPYRVEFTGWPSYLQPGAFNGAAAGNGSSVQFVPDGNSGNVNFALHNPADFCGNSNARLVSVCFTVGDNTAPANANQAAVRHFAYSAAQTGAFGTIPLSVEATAGQVGTIYGMAFDSATRTLLGSAYVRRGAGLGPSNSTGTIYRMPLGGTPSVFLELNGLAGIDTGANPHPNGVTPNWITDPATFPVVAKVGLGDLDFSEDGRTLYTVNLNQRELLILPIGDGLTPPAAGDILRRPVPVPASCNGDGVSAPAASDIRPFALAFNDGVLYLGMVCSAQSMLQALNPAPATIADLAAVRAAMRAYIYRFDPAANSFDAAPLLEFPLNYPRLQVNDALTTAPANDGEWLPWIDTWYPAYAPRQSSGGLFANPQPLLTDIEFDTAGSMFLGFRDRFGDQSYSTDPGPGGGPNRSTRIGGDLLLACQSGGAWTLEANGSCGGRTTTTLRAGSGPGGGEFYSDERYSPYHEETALGGLTYLAGSGEIISSVYDSRATFENGLMAFNNATGLRNRSVQLYAPNTRFQKAAGLGDVELLCDQAPIEVGNRLWRDDDGDGVQDPGEPPLPNVSVELYRNGARIGVATTDADGEYYFRSGTAATDPDPNDPIINDGGVGIRPRTGTPGGASEYQIRIPNSSGGAQQAALAGLRLTAPDADPSANGDSRDSDGAVSGTDATFVIPYQNLASAGSNNHTYDFGFVRYYALGNRVWEDVNNNGALDPGELGIDGVTVSLYLDAAGDGFPDGPPLATSPTADGGYYRFDNLAANTYIVEVAPPAGYASSTNGEEADPDSDGDSTDNGTVAAGAAIRSAPVTLDPGTLEPPGEADLSPSGQGAPDAQANMTVDFGFFRPLSLGDLVWNDGNNNGRADPGEPGIDGVTVELYLDSNSSGSYEPGVDTLAATDTTAAGLYRFDGLLPGGYLVVLPAGNFGAGAPLANHTSSTGGGSEPAPDVDADPENNDDNGTASGALGAGGIIASQAITLLGNSEPTNDGDSDANTNLSVDFGLFQLSSIGDLVWFDNDADGALDAGESGAPGVTVTLFRGDNTQVGATTTDGAGSYGFTGLIPGDYYVVFSGLPAGHVFTGQDLAADTIDSDADPANGRAALTTLAPGENDSTWDAGIFQLAGLGNYVWEDLNGDGQQGAGEPGVPGVTVRLLDNLGAGLASAITDPSGYYFFGGLPPGSYQVEFAPPAGHRLTQPNQSDDALDSDADPVTARSPLVTLAAGESNPTIDAGILRPASLGDRVWEDLDRDGQQDAGEPGVSGVTVRLLDGGGLLLETATTGPDGFYQFSDLAPGAPYQVEFVLPPDYSLTDADQGDDTFDSDADRTSGRTSVVTLQSGENNPTLDAGIFQAGILSLGDLVWNDINNNGRVDAGEPGIAGVAVTLYADASGDSLPDGPALASVATDASGNYLFGGLTPGGYLVTIAPPAGYAGSTGANGSASGPYEPGVGGDSNLNDQDHGSASGGVITSGTVTLASGAEPVDDGDADANSNLSVDFGLFQPASLGSFVWRDLDENGIFDPGEPPVPGVTVTLYDPLGTVIATTTTDANGVFLFTNLTPGTYVVGFSNLPPDTTFSPPNQGGDDGNDSDVDTATGRTGPVTLAPGQNNPTLWAGLIPAPPTAVTLRSFTASWDGKTLLVRWETGLELNTAGFHLLRSASGGRADAVRVTPALITAEGRGGAGASYSWRDAAAQAGASYTYWLEEVETSGARYVYGPATAGGAPAQGGFQVSLPLLRR